METNILRFEHPEYLYWLAIIPILIGIYITIRFISKKRFQVFAESKFRDLLIPLISTSRSNIKFTLFLIVIILGILAAANLQTGSKMEEVKREGIDLYFCVDISNSMNAEDIAPNRLERSKQAINNLINKLNGDRIGVIIFAGNAYVQLPITTDYAAAKMFLSTIDTDLIPTQGTEVGAAINLAVKSFGNNDHGKAIIIISDGEDHENGAAIKAAQEAAQLGIKIYTIGMGLEDGAPIPLYNQYGKRIGYKKDRDGNIVITKLDDNLLRQIAEIGDGIYRRASNSNVGLDEIFEDINKAEKSEIDSKVFTDYEDQFQWFLGAAIIILIIELLISSGKKDWETKFNFFEPKDENN
ncbi:MAG: VWA domain-containing protein [Lentimicrobiaceae bacterium]|nr:VWA domain-containing protein [Lentimicrobiaceae bacterium]